MVERSPDMRLVGYAMARLGEVHPDGSDRPPAWLGVTRWNEAYDLFFDALGDGRTQTSFGGSLKNARDTVDPYVGSSRRGWRTPDGEPPEPGGWVKDILDAWASRSDEELRLAVEAILARPSVSRTGVSIDNWADVRRRIERTTRETVAKSGKVQRRMLKGKELRCVDLKAALDELLRRQGYRCAQTGVAFLEADPELRASLDRIDSDGHYEDGSLGDGPHNLQLVTHWYNITKGVRSDADMLRLLGLHARESERWISEVSRSET